MREVDQKPTGLAQRAQAFIHSPKGLLTGLSVSVVAALYLTYALLSFAANTLVLPVIALTTNAKKEDVTPLLAAWLLTLYASFRLIQYLTTPDKNKNSIATASPKSKSTTSRRGIIFHIPNEQPDKPNTMRFNSQGPLQ